MEKYNTIFLTITIILMFIIFFWIFRDYILFLKESILNIWNRFCRLINLKKKEIEIKIETESRIQAIENKAKERTYEIQDNFHKKAQYLKDQIKKNKQKAKEIKNRIKSNI